MLLIASDNSKGVRAVSAVARELSLTLTIFATAGTLAELMGGSTRRIVLLTEADVSEAVATTLRNAEHSAHFGVIVAAERQSPRDTAKVAALEQLARIENLEWIGPDFDHDELAAAARECRGRLLHFSREELDEGLRDRRFIVKYQPKVERGSSSEWLTREAEAMVRWRHPERGLIGPLEFLPDIEAAGLTARLTDYVLEEAAAQLVRWKNKGLDLCACINLASSQLVDDDLATRCAGIVGRFGLDCSRFTFEVADQDLADPAALHLQTLKSLRDQGFRLCLDNFRVAAASLGTMEQLPFDEIKIHASAIARAQNNPVRQKVLAAIIGLAHSLDMTVCVEGIKDEPMFKFLRTIECDKMQGPLIAEAVLPKLLRKVYGPGPDADQVA